MVYIKEKVINGRKYFYATKSVRLPDNKVATIQKALKKRDEKVPESFFEGKEKELYKKWVLKTYKTDSVFLKSRICEIEETRLDYKKVLKRLTVSQKRDLWNRFVANFTFESNAIEGNSLTLKDVTLALFEKITPEGKDLREIYETKNTREVLDLVIKGRFKVRKKDIIKMHKMLVKDMGIEKGFKKIPNYLVGRKVKTTPPEKVEDEIGKMIDYFENSPGLHPIKVAAKMHGWFEKIHPFDDGNGRVGRFLINVALIQKGYMPLIIRKSQRTAYFKALEDYDNGYEPSLERFLLEKYRNTYKNFFEEYLKYI